MGEGAAWPALRMEPVNIFTATPRGRKLRQQRLKFWIVRLPRFAAENIFNRRPLVATLKRLDLLHTATWNRVGTFPSIAGATPESDRIHWVMFTANFNGGWAPYRDSFLAVLMGGVTTLWSPSIDFPRFPGPGTRYRTEQWSDSRLPETLHYYSAYPGATGHDVRAALRVSRELRGLVAMASAEWPAPLTAFAPRAGDLGQLIRRLQNCLGELVPTPEPWPALGPSTATAIASAVSMAPVDPVRLAELESAIDALGNGPDSPFARVEGTHFARLVIVDRRIAGRHPRSQIRLANSWLMLAADFDSHVPTDVRASRPSPIDLRRYFESIARRPQLARLWNYCQGRGSSSSLVDYLLQTVPDQLLSYRDYPAATLREILVALERQDLLRRWAAAHNAADTDGFAALCHDARAVAARR